MGKETIGQTTGTCAFCGQTVMLDMEKGATEEERDNMATLKCGCKQSLATQEKQNRCHAMMEGIEAYFSQEAEKWRGGDEESRILRERLLRQQDAVMAMAGHVLDNTIPHAQIQTEIDTVFDIRKNKDGDVLITRSMKIKDEWVF